MDWLSSLRNEINDVHDSTDLSYWNARKKKLVLTLSLLRKSITIAKKALNMSQNEATRLCKDHNFETFYNTYDRESICKHCGHRK